MRRSVLWSLALVCALAWPGPAPAQQLNRLLQYPRLEVNGGLTGIAPRAFSEKDGQATTVSYYPGFNLRANYGFLTGPNSRMKLGLDGTFAYMPFEMVTLSGSPGKQPGHRAAAWPGGEMWRFQTLLTFDYDFRDFTVNTPRDWTPFIKIGAGGAMSIFPAWRLSTADNDETSPRATVRGARIQVAFSPVLAAELGGVLNLSRVAWTFSYRYEHDFFISPGARFYGLHSLNFGIRL